MPGRSQGEARCGRAGRHTAGGGAETDNGLQVVNAAIEFVKIAGSLEQAKAALGTIENIGHALNGSGEVEFVGRETNWFFGSFWAI